jgi:hypothetical protein
MTAHPCLKVWLLCRIMRKVYRFAREAQAITETRDADMQSQPTCRGRTVIMPVCRAQVCMIIW